MLTKLDRPGRTYNHPRPNGGQHEIQENMKINTRGQQHDLLVFMFRFSCMARLWRRRGPKPRNPRYIRQNMKIDYGATMAPTWKQENHKNRKSSKHENMIFLFSCISCFVFSWRDYGWPPPLGPSGPVKKICSRARGCSGAEAGATAALGGCAPCRRNIKIPF